MMRARTAKVAGVIEKLNLINRDVSEAVKRATGVNPRTRVAGLTRGTFSVDVATGKIYAVPLGDEALLEGYLTHENGHRSVFPVSSAGSIAFISSIKSERPDASDDAVMAAANAVADVLSDYVLFKQGLGRVLGKRIPDLLTKIQADSLPLAFKAVACKGMELALKRKSETVSQEDLARATEWLVAEKGVDRALAEKARKIAEGFLRCVDMLLYDATPKEIAEHLLNPFAGHPPGSLWFAVNTAVKLLDEDQQSGKGKRAGRSSSGSSKEGGGGGKGESEEPEGAEGADIMPSKIDPTDIQKAVVIAQVMFATGGRVTQAIEAVFSKQIRDAVKKLLEKLKIVFAQNDFKTYRPSGYEKRKTELWLRPRGEPDEDSVLMEPRKLLWTVSYRVPRRRGVLFTAPASVPEKLIVVQDESGSTISPFGATTVLSAEAFVSLVVLAGLRYKGGAKKIEVIKFSDVPHLSYRGNDDVDAGAKLLVPSPVAGGGTNIVDAVSKAIRHGKKNTAITVVTDAEIGDFEADEIGKMLKSAVDSGKVGFVVFIVVNPERPPSLAVLGRHLHGRNAIIEHIATPDDLVQVSNNIMAHILKTYSS